MVASGKCSSPRKGGPHFCSVVTGHGPRLPAPASCRWACSSSHCICRLFSSSGRPPAPGRGPRLPACACFNCSPPPAARRLQAGVLGCWHVPVFALPAALLAALADCSPPPTARRLQAGVLTCRHPPVFALPAPLLVVRDNCLPSSAARRLQAGVLGCRQPSVFALPAALLVVRGPRRFQAARWARQLSSSGRPPAPGRGPRLPARACFRSSCSSSRCACRLSSSSGRPPAPAAALLA